MWVFLNCHVYCQKHVFYYHDIRAKLVGLHYKRNGIMSVDNNIVLTIILPCRLLLVFCNCLKDI